MFKKNVTLFNLTTFIDKQVNSTTTTYKAVSFNVIKIINDFICFFNLKAFILSLNFDILYSN